MSQLSARDHATRLYTDMLKSLKRFYEAERDYDAIVEEVAQKRFHEPFDALTSSEKRQVKHHASTEKLLDEAAGRATYARDRTAMLAQAYLATRDWQDREDKAKRRYCPQTHIHSDKCELYPLPAEHR